jgi:hypothetical protein
VQLTDDERERYDQENQVYFDHIDSREFISGRKTGIRSFSSARHTIHVDVEP